MKQIKKAAKSRLMAAGRGRKISIRVKIKPLKSGRVKWQKLGKSSSRSKYGARK